LTIIKVTETPSTEGENVPTSMIGRVMRTFELLAGDPLTAAELARRLGINRSTALRLLSELVETGYVRRDSETKRFATVPSRFLNLIARQDQHADWTQIIDPILAEIRDETGESTILGVPTGHTMVYLAYFPTFHVLAVAEQLGTVRPMHCSALGKAYLSALDPGALDSELDRLPYVGGTDRASHSEAELRARVLLSREDGYALDLDETFDDVRCVAVPLRVRGSLAGAVGISGPVTRFAMPRMRELGGYLIQKLSGL
jgi:DNA-binding IclR family transcriptional regulator